MEVKTIIKEIQRLPLYKRFFVMEQTLKSIKKEELGSKSETNHKYKEETIASIISANEKSLSKDWLSEEDNRWDKIL